MGLDLMLVERVAQATPEDPSRLIWEGALTHNLAAMARACGLWEPMWGSAGKEREASQVVEPIEQGLKRLRASQARLRKLEPSNGWGRWEDLEAVAVELLRQARAQPGAILIACA